MPKMRKRITKGQKTKNHNVLRKFRIGNRKNGLAAEQMTTESLIKVLADTSKKKYHKNAVAVLRTRPINI